MFVPDFLVIIFFPDFEFIDIEEIFLDVYVRIGVFRPRFTRRRSGAPCPAIRSSRLLEISIPIFLPEIEIPIFLPEIEIPIFEIEIRIGIGEQVTENGFGIDS